MAQKTFCIFSKKYKNQGISLPLAFITSMLVLILALYTLNSISRSFERTVGIERSNKVFFAAESGVEAAFFHKNSRIKGAHFDWESWKNTGNNLCKDNPTELECPNWLKTTRLNHADTSTEARWRLLTRFQPTGAGDRVYSGVLREYETIEIPFYYDGAPLSTNTGTTEDRLESTSITVNFPKIAPTGFDFGDQRTIAPPVGGNPPEENLVQRKERPVIDWSLSKLHATNGVQTFIPDTDLGNPCYKDGTLVPRSMLICEDNLRPETATSTITITLNLSTVTGRVQPCLTPGGCATNLQSFFDGVDSSQYKLRLQSLLPYTDEGSGDKIANIPFTITLPDPGGGSEFELPTNTYTIVSKVTKDDYTKEVSFTVNESAGIGAFNYVIFD